MLRSVFKVLSVLCAALLLLVSAPSTPTPLLAASLSSETSISALSFQERLACQRTIEQVYWQHRTWLPENSQPKPALDIVLPEAVLVTKVDDTIRLSNALETYWHQPITGAMLQAEITRMATGTRQPELLKELFGALGNDPTRIAECLARPALATRLMHNHYQQDARIHGMLEAEVMAQATALESPEDLHRTTGTYQEMVWRLDRDTTEVKGDGIPLSANAWAAERTQLATWFATSPTTLPVGRISPVQENQNSFFVVALLEQTPEQMTIGTVRWERTPFATWWRTERKHYPTDLVVPRYEYTLPAIQGEGEFKGDASWLPTPSLPTRYNGTVLWTGSEMIVWGGGSLGTGRSNEGWAYNPATDTWLTINNINAPVGRYRHTAVWTGTEMIVWGGCSSSSFRLCELSSGGRFNPGTGLWTATALTDVPTGRIDHTAVWTGNEMIVWGGCQPVTDAECDELPSGGRYDPETDTWVSTNVSGAPSGRTEHSAIWTGAEMIVWGGNDGMSRTDTGGRYDPDSDAWIATSTTLAPSPRMNHTAIWTGTEMVIWGGCSSGAGCIVQGEPLSTGSRYSPATDTWIPMSATGEPSARTGHTAVWIGSDMLIWGGGNSSTLFRDGGRYSPATDTWTPLSTVNAPSARAGHSAVWTGSEMIIWGIVDASGGRYDPGTDTWTPTDMQDPDGVQSKHTAVWTGVEMIIWGGQRLPDGTSDKGRLYNPTTREWREVAMEGRPVFRDSHTAVWTGSEMLVWGGNANTTLLNDGGRYNPVSNTWTPITTAGAPAPRYGHTAVWTGSEMVVWGANGNTGGRYNPSTNSWTPTSTLNAPSARGGNTAVWTGTEMIVWGGVGSEGELNTGGRYNPTTNTWVAMTTTGAPAPRFEHTAVWTGERMIVWGGVDFDFNGNVLLNSGGEYDPVTDSWQSTPLLGAPEGRVEFTAIWTGAEMIVWGGCIGASSCGTPIYSGAHYNPTTDTWSPTVIDRGVPRARGEHSAVWTGDRMIVWGGYTSASTYTNTGSEYSVDAPGNQPPVARADTYGTQANTPLTVATPGVLANDEDADGHPLTAVLLTSPEDGTLQLNGNGAFTYTPDSGFSGNDSFTYRAWDGFAYSNEVGVTITVTSVGGTPTPTPVPPTGTVSATATPIPPTATPQIPTVTATMVSSTPTMTTMPTTPTATATGMVSTPTATPSPTATLTPNDPFGLFLPFIRR
jgi:N-acetylneuraminic acid mutarotase